MTHKSIQALREQKQELARELRNQIEQKGDRVWSKDDQAAFDAKSDDMERIERQISSIEKQLQREAEEKFTDAGTFRTTGVIGTTNDAEAQRRAIFDKMLRNGPTALTSDEMRQIRNTTSTTTPSQGGYTVQQNIAKELIDAIKGFKGMRDVAQQMTTENGASLSYPSSDGTGEVGELVAENQTAANADPSFGTLALPTYKFGSKSFAIPLELLQDASIDIVAMVKKRASTRIGRIQNQMFTTGTGSSQPNGLVTGAGVGKTGTTGQTLTVIYDDLVDLVDAVDYAYDDGTFKFMFGQSTRKVVRKIKDTAGRPIWTPSYEGGIAGKFADQLLGFDVQLNNDMPVPAANAKSIAFGRLGEYMIRDAMEITLFRFEDSAFMLKGQVGFVAWARAGGNLLDPLGVKVYQHSAS